jgi:hypothetical protein
MNFNSTMDNTLGNTFINFLQLHNTWTPTKIKVLYVFMVHTYKGLNLIGATIGDTGRRPLKVSLMKFHHASEASPKWSNHFTQDSDAMFYRMSEPWSRTKVGIGQRRWCRHGWDKRSKATPRWWRHRRMEARGITGQGHVSTLDWLGT